MRIRPTREADSRVYNDVKPRNKGHSIGQLGLALENDVTSILWITSGGP